MREVHVVRSPENVVFELDLAGLSTRALAWAIDVCVMAALVGMAASVFSIFDLVFAGFAQAIHFVVLFGIQWGYGLVMEWRFQGQTVGKRALGIRVLAANGVPVRFGQAALRNLLRVLDILPGGYLLGGACALFDRRARRFGDMVADTVVVVVGSMPAARAVDAPAARQRYNSFADDAWVLGAAEAIPEAERAVMRALCERREQLPLPVRCELFAKLARHLQRKLGIAPIGHLSDERVVLNLLAISAHTRQRSSGEDEKDRSWIPRALL